MKEKTRQKLSAKTFEKLLNQQTTIILNAVDEQLAKQQKHSDYRISAIEKRLGTMEIRINQKLDRLITTLDKFLKRLTDLEEEFELLKADLKRIKTILREKLGAVID